MVIDINRRVIDTNDHGGDDRNGDGDRNHDSCDNDDDRCHDKYDDEHDIVYRKKRKKRDITKIYPYGIHISIYFIHISETCVK